MIRMCTKATKKITNLGCHLLFFAFQMSKERSHHNYRRYIMTDYISLSSLSQVHVLSWGETWKITKRSTWQQMYSTWQNTVVACKWGYLQRCAFNSLWNDLILMFKPILMFKHNLCTLKNWIFWGRWHCHCICIIKHCIS